jgi:hypothetical protein
MGWRDFFKVHPAADLFPMMGDEELAELGADIRANGLAAKIIFLEDPDGTVVVVDGRNRLGAMERAGLSMKDIPGVPLGHHVDPVAYLISTNIRRRHLTREQKREVIAALLRLAPERSDRQVATDVGASHRTVGAVREDLESSGQIAHSAERVGADGRTTKAAKAKAEPADELYQRISRWARDLGVLPPPSELGVPDQATHVFYEAMEVRNYLDRFLAANAERQRWQEREAEHQELRRAERERRASERGLSKVGRCPGCHRFTSDPASCECGRGGPSHNGDRRAFNAAHGVDA